MTKNVIAIISVLKPVDDTRNYEKIASSISNTNKYDINIIGFSPKRIPVYPNITFHAIFNFKRTSIRRLWASISIWKVLLKLKPELIIVTTSELLIVSSLYKILFGTKIMYDVQENYYRNIAYTNLYPLLLRYPIAVAIRTIELVTSLFIDTNILAEKVYLSQMKYVSSKAIVIENKALIPDYVKNETRTGNKNLVLLYSGTIAEHYGIFDAIEFIKNLKMMIDDVQLIIIGYASQDKIYQKLLKQTKNLTCINIIGGNALVPHSQILMEMNKADFCILPYQTHRSTEGKIPTKLFECLAMEKPVIITPNSAWDSIITQNNAGIIHDFKSIDPSFLQQLQYTYYGNRMSSQYVWDQSSDKLIKVIQGLI